MSNRFIVTMKDQYDEGDIAEFLYHGSGEKVVWDGYRPEPMKETWERADGRPRMTTKQRDALWELCGRYNVPFREDDYAIQTSSMMQGYVEGWVGGIDYSAKRYGRPETVGKSTVYVGVSPDGRVHT